MAEALSLQNPLPHLPLIPSPFPTWPRPRSVSRPVFSCSSCPMSRSLLLPKSPWGLSWQRRGPSRGSGSEGSPRQDSPLRVASGWRCPVPSSPRLRSGHRLRRGSCCWKPRPVPSRPRQPLPSTSPCPYRGVELEMVPEGFWQLV